MAKAEIITIGTELLLGEIVDTNSRYLARTLRDEGVDLYWTSTVGDNEERIAEAIRQGIARSEIIITTGGLGPTIDDPTRAAVARAVGVENQYRPDLWEQIKERFARFDREPTENNKRQAFIPAGAIPIENPVGTAPSFIVETDRNAIISLPGVPREMEYLMKHDIIPYLRKRFKLSGIIKARVLRTAGVGESVIDELIADLETGTNPTVGLAAHAGSVDVRITAKAASVEQANTMIAGVEKELRARLKSWIYGADEETLEGAALQNMAKKGWSFVVVESGLGGQLTQRLVNTDSEHFLGGEVLTTRPSNDELSSIAAEFRHSRSAAACLGVALIAGEDKQVLQLTLITPIKTRQLTRSYGGPPQMARRWAVNSCLNFIRRLRKT
ncbi:MAG: CinA family nicotinamide mononucleotide deamidase-related protein [Anaerolineae bacterium]|nr:CinA family nicotinamide mononucleotide deamidase-related protein [Anaerolineae bacterium]